MAKTNNDDFNINDYKDQIDKYIKERVDKESASEAVKFYKKRIRNKNIAIFVEFIIILILIASLVVGGIYLYNDGYFNKYELKINRSEKPTTNTDEQENEKTDEKKNKLSELVNKYSYLIVDINMDTKSEYLTEFYSGNLSTELKEYLAFQLIDKNYITTDNNSSYFDAQILKSAYKELFGEDIEYKDFKFNGAFYKYLRVNDMFISTTLSTTGNKIIKEITNIEEKDDKVIITTTEGYIKDNHLYNVLSKKEITDYKKDEKISKYSKKLNIVKYTFNNEVLESIK